MKCPARVTIGGRDIQCRLVLGHAKLHMSQLRFALKDPDTGKPVSITVFRWETKWPEKYRKTAAPSEKVATSKKE